jgi:hypothetical protein
LKSYAEPSLGDSRDLVDLSKARICFNDQRFRITALVASGHMATSPKYIEIFIANMPFMICD